ncbi:protein kinase domain-containing protein [Dactylosporangium sp. CA-092794]|uniref:serine/threonine-protein kinase n=1 Tax=Dactylosporangium sp. CA-092794 TaxID=3239929 RepID=UPI003D945C9B
MDGKHLLGGRYLLDERLGEGGMSVVWRAHDRVLGREVAVKVLAPALAGDDEARHRIRLEARAAARLSHPNITSVYDYGETAEHVPFVVMELLRGPTLADRLLAGPLPPAAAVRICAEVAAGLAAAHAEDLVHRDVKPANVILTPDAAKVLDFGIVGFVGIPDVRHDPALVIGTPAYLAPERLVSDDVTPASDVYAFGLLLYRCLTGRLPWDSETTTQMVMAHITVAPEPLPELPGVPAEVRELCMSCLAKEPRDRPAAVAVAAGLARAAGIVPRFSVVLQEPAPGAPPPPDHTTHLVAPPAPDEPDEPEDSDEPDEPGGSRRQVLLGVGVLAAIAALLVGIALSRSPAGSRTSAEGMPVGGGAPAPTASPSAPSSEAPPPAVDPTTTTGDPASVAASNPGAGDGEQGDQDQRGNQNGQGGDPGMPTDAGVIVAVCVGKKVSVLHVAPADGVKLVEVEPGLRSNTRVEFDRDGQRLRYVVTCRGGAPGVAIA